MGSHISIKFGKGFRRMGHPIQSLDILIEEQNIFIHHLMKVCIHAWYDYVFLPPANHIYQMIYFEPQL